jgi:hypothetical protein
MAYFATDPSYTAPQARGVTSQLRMPTAPPRPAPAPAPMSRDMTSTNQVTTLRSAPPTAPRTPTATGYQEMNPTQATYQSPWDPRMTQGINNQLINILGQDPNNVSITDSDIAPIAQTQDAVFQRQARMARDSAAERAAAEGTLEGGGFSSEVRRIQDAARGQQAQLEAGLVNEKAQERRAQIMQALQLGSGLIDSDTERSLKTELANMDNRFRYDDMNSRNRLGYADLDLRGELGRGDLDIRRQDLSLRDKLGTGELDLGNRRLDQDQRQFDDRLGFDRTRYESDYNARIAQYLMGL